MRANSSVQERMRAKSLARNIEQALMDEGRAEERQRLFVVLEDALRSGRDDLIRQLHELIGNGGMQRRFHGFIQQICETSMDRQAMAEIIAVPVILAAESGRSGSIANQIDDAALGPLESVMQLWAPGNARVRMFGALFDKDDLEQHFPSGALRLKDSLCRALAENRTAQLPKPFSPRALQSSGRPGENWLLRYMVGAIVRPMSDDLQQLPSITPDSDKLDEWRQAMATFLSLHLQSEGTTFDVLPGVPGQLSYALEQGEAMYCLLELEHFGLKRASAMRKSQQFPVAASFHEARRIWIVTAGDTPDILWDATIPCWLNDADGIDKALDEMAERAGVARFERMRWPEYRAWRQQLKPAPFWLSDL